MASSSDEWQSLCIDLLRDGGFLAGVEGRFRPLIFARGGGLSILILLSRFKFIFLILSLAMLMEVAGSCRLADLCAGHRRVLLRSCSSPWTKGWSTLVLVTAVVFSIPFVAPNSSLQKTELFEALVYV